MGRSREMKAKRLNTITCGSEVDNDEVFKQESVALALVWRKTEHSEIFKFTRIPAEIP